MAFLGSTFSVNELPQSDRSYDLLPEGWYTAKITDAKLNPTKSGTGEKIDVRYDILGPSQQGRVMFSAINIRNQSAEAERIGLQQLGEVMRAIGLDRIENTDQLIGGELQIKVRVKQPSERDKSAGYDQARNDIGGYKACEGRSAPLPSAAPQASSAPAAGATPPWAKK
jgi:hypothetical protein